MITKDIVKAGLLNGLGVSKGAEAAPAKIQQFLKQLETDCRFHEALVDNQDVAGSFAAIKRALEPLGQCIVVGGDHSVTYPCFESFAQKHKGKNIGLVILDAHPDCVHDFYPPTHEDFVRTLIERGMVEAKNVYLVGIRQMDPIERQYINQKGINCYTMELIDRNGIGDFCDGLMESVRGLDAFYLSIDIDVLDPAFAPGTGYPEPGGMSTRELFYILRRLKLLRNLLMADVVEVNPAKDAHDATSLLASRIVVELLR